MIKREINLPEPKVDIGSLSEYFKEADKAADAWQKFNNFILPMFWDDIIGFETLLRTGEAEILVSERHMDNLSFVRNFCKIKEIMSMDLVDGTTLKGSAVIHAAKGQRFGLLLSRKCALATEFVRLRSAA